MTLRAGHGTGGGVPRIEVLPADELPRGVQAPAHAEARDERTADGKWVKGTRTAQSQGGKAHKETSQLATRLALGSLVVLPEFQPYLRQGRHFGKTHRRALARSVGGGVCGVAPSSLVTCAAMQLAASHYLFAKAAETGDPALFGQASKLADAHRQNLLAAHELCAREAKQRPPTNAHDALAALGEEGGS